MCTICVSQFAVLYAALMAGEIAGGVPVGSWVLSKVQYSVDNKVVSSETVSDERIVISVRGNAVFFSTADKQTTCKATFFFAKTPKQADIFLDLGRKKKDKIRCIYEIKEGLLKVCFHVGVVRVTGGPSFDPDAPRPLTFVVEDLPTVTLFFHKQKH